MRQIFNRICLALVAGAAICSALSGYEMYRDPMPAGIFAPRDAANIGQECFENLRPALRGAKVAGYIASRPPVSANDMGAYFLAQYFLAPTVLRLGPVEPLVVANLDTQQELDRFLREADYEIVMLLHPGVAVVHKKGSP